MQMKQLVSFVLLVLLFGAAASPVEAKLWVNEFSSSGSSDWVEIYNDDETAAALNDYRLRDSSSTNKLDLTGTIGGKSFTVFDWGDRLNNGGDAIRLLKKNDESQVEDTVIYGSLDGSIIAAPAAGQFVARIADGGSDFALFASDTRGSTNSNAPPIPTATATPTDTPKPTPSPPITKALTPTKAPTPTKIVSPTSLKLTATTAQKTTVARSSNTQPTPTIDYEMPTAVLAASTESDRSETFSPHPTEALKTLASSSFNPAPIIIGLALIMLVGSGGFAYYQYRRNR